MSTPNYHHGNLKNALVEAALAQVSREGAASLNLRALARSLGVTHPAVYRHFANKEALLEAVAQHGFETLATTLEDAVAETSSEETLEALITAYVGFAAAHPELSRVMFALVSAQARADNPELYAATKKAYAVLLSSIGETPGGEQVRGPVVWALVHGLAQLTVEKQLDKLGDPEQRSVIIKKAAEVIRKGLDLQ